MNNVIHMADKWKISIVLSKVSGFSYCQDKQDHLIRIFTTGDIDPFVCLYPSLEYLLSDLERLSSSLEVYQDKHFNPKDNG